MKAYLIEKQDPGVALQYQDPEIAILIEEDKDTSCGFLGVEKTAIDSFGDLILEYVEYGFDRLLWPSDQDDRRAYDQQ